MYLAVFIPPLRFFRLGGESRYGAWVASQSASSFGSLQKSLPVRNGSRKGGCGTYLAVANRPHGRQQKPTVRKATERYRSSLSIGLAIQVHRLVVRQLLEFRGRYLVGGQMLPVLVIPNRIRFRWLQSSIVSQRSPGAMIASRQDARSRAGRWTAVQSHVAGAV